MNLVSPRKQGTFWDEQEPEETLHTRAEENIDPATILETTGMVGGSGGRKTISNSRGRGSEGKFAGNLGASSGKRQT